MTLYWAPAALAALASSTGAGALMIAARYPRARWSLVAIFITMAGIQASEAMTILFPSHLGLWRQIAVVTELALAIAVLYAGLALSGMTGLTSGSTLHVRAASLGLVCLALGSLVWPAFEPLPVPVTSESSFSIPLTAFGRVIYISLIAVLTLGVAQLEQILRASQQSIRYQIKFVTVGIGAVAGFGLYQASKMALIPQWEPSYAIEGGAATLLCVAVIWYGVWRLHLGEVPPRIYVAPKVLYGSISFIAIGVYLFTVGLAAQVLRLTGFTIGQAVSILVVLAGVVALVVLATSRRVRAEVNRYLTRHFYRSKYDYRSKWLEVTEGFRHCVSTDDILDNLLEVLTKTFGSRQIAIWMPFDSDGGYRQVRSLKPDVSPPALDPLHPIIDVLSRTDEFLTQEDPVPAIEHEAVKAFWRRTEAIVCAPIRADDRLLCFVTLGRELNGEPYEQDDMNLLMAIVYHAGMLLSLAQLSEQRRVAAELEALHRVSAFCLHDLKNLAAKLSLVTQNAQDCRNDALFQQSAMRTVSSTVTNMLALIGKLSASTDIGAASPGPEDPGCSDVHALLDEILKDVERDSNVGVRQVGVALPPVLIRRDQLHQVLLNVIFNAKQACECGGLVTIHTKLSNDKAVIQVRDTGPGIPAASLRTLFRPFQSTKKGGLGVGLYECRRIVEASQGTMTVDSTEGVGTIVQIALPISKEVTANV